MSCLHPIYILTSTMASALFSESGKEITESIKAALPLDREYTGKAVPIPGTKEQGYSPIYRNKYSPQKLISVPHPAVTTYKQLLSVAVDAYGDNKCLGARSKDANGKLGPYEWITYLEVYVTQKNFGLGLFFILQNNPFKTNSEAHRKIDTHHEKFGGASCPANESGYMSFVVTLFSHNTREWAIADLACASYAITNTSLYDTLGPETAEYILELTESPVVVATKDKLQRLVDLKHKHPQQLSNLIALVLMNPLDASDSRLIETARENNIVVYDFDQVTKLGEMARVPKVDPTPESVYTISFTSGTTSNPKGVVLTHANLVASVAFCFTTVTPVDNPVTYCFLPLAHIFQRMGLAFAFFVGAGIGMPQSPSPLTLLEDVQLLKPHTVALVPRVLNKFEAAIKAQTVNNEEKPLLRKLFSNAINKKLELMSQHDGAEGRHLLHDRLLGLLRKKLGFQNLIGLSTGSAPVSLETVKFLKAALNTGINQGYGLTESFAGVCSSIPYEAEPGSCGAICVTTEMRLKDLPEMNYTSEDAEGPRGELLLRGPQIFKEYFKNEEETRKAKDSEGWFHTGDVARLDPNNGRIYIIDRAKNFFKLAQGEYITPEKVENAYLSAFPHLAQIYVHGDSFKTHLVGIVGVEPEEIKQWLRSRVSAPPSQLDSPEAIVQLMNKPDVKVKFLKEMNDSVGGALHGLERLHNISIGIEPLKLEDGVITPTMKIKRPVAAKFFANTFDKLYDEGSLIRTNESKL